MSVYSSCVIGLMSWVDTEGSPVLFKLWQATIHIN